MDEGAEWIEASGRTATENAWEAEPVVTADAVSLMPVAEESAGRREADAGNAAESVENLEIPSALRERLAESDSGNAHKPDDTFSGQIDEWRREEELRSDNGESDIVALLGEEEIIASGNCGPDGSDSLIWKLDSDGVLTVSGAGEMDYYGIPRYLYRDATIVILLMRHSLHDAPLLT